MQAGDILLFVGQKVFIDEAIEYETSSKYTHAALAISETEYVEAWWSGVRKAELNPNDPRKFDIYTTITPLTDLQKAEITGFALGKIGEEYNFLQLIGFPVEKLFHTDKNVLGSTHKVICSQLVIQSYKAVGIVLLPNIEEYSVAPSDLANSKLLRQEGLACQ